MFANRMTIQEGMLVMGGFLGLIGLQIGATNSSYLLQKYFWIDEICTYTLLTDADLAHAIRALQGAVDINPPGLHLLLLAYTTLANSTSEVALRIFALLSMVLALAGVYAALREVYGALAAIAASLAIWSHPLILDHAFEVRYYGPWFAAAIWFCYLLGRARAQTLGAWGTVALALTSFVLCTVHYFGILTLLIIVGCEWLWQRRRPIYAGKNVAAIALGPIALAGSALFLLPYQRAVTTVSTWIADPTLAAIADFGMTLFLPLHLGAVVMAGWFSRLTARDAEPDTPSWAAELGSSALVGLTSLVLLFPALIAFSFLVQSVLVSRYGIPAIAGIAPAVAYVVSRMTRGWVILLIVFFVAASAYGLHQRSARAREGDLERRELIQAIRAHTGDSPVLFEAPHQLYVVWHYAKDLRGRVFLLDFETAQFADNVSRFRIWTRDLARQFVKFYGAPALMAWDQIRHAKALYIVPHPLTYAREPGAHERYPQFVMTRIRGQLHQLVRTSDR